MSPSRRRQAGPAWVGLLLASCPLAVRAQAPAHPQTAVRGVPANVRFVPDVAYRTVGKEKLSLDLAYPKLEPNQTSRPLPTVLLLHGAGPLSRRKDACFSIAMELAQRGYVSVAINYRHRPQGEYLAPIHDAKAAVRWIRQQARDKQYPIDEDRIGALGYSAGSALACLLGMTQKEDGLEEVNDPRLPSSRVRAVVGYFGPSDMTMLHDTWSKTPPQVMGLEDFRDLAQRPFLKNTLESWLGGDPGKVARHYQALSPIRYVRKDVAPMLLLHGRADRVVPPEHSEVLTRKLKEVNAPVKLLLFDDARHDFDEHKDINAEMAVAATLTFLQSQLGKR